MKDLTADELRTSWPDARLSELLDSAQRHLLNNQPHLAIAVWQQMIQAGGGDADWGHLEYADHLLREGRADEAQSELAALMAGRQVFSHPWRLAAELLEDWGRLEDALFWYSAAAGCLSDEELRYANGPVWAREIRAGRRRLRWKMRIRLDDTDLLVRMGDAEADQKWLGLLDLLATPEVIDGHLQFWARHEPHSAATESAAENGPTDDAAPGLDGYFRRVEGALQAHGGRIILLPRTPENLVPAALVAFDARHIEELPSLLSRYDDGSAVEWPPGRNQACWCGSGTKYKRCCGANSVAA